MGDSQKKGKKWRQEASKGKQANKKSTSPKSEGFFLSVSDHFLDISQNICSWYQTVPFKTIISF